METPGPQTPQPPQEPGDFGPGYNPEPVEEYRHRKDPIPNDVGETSAEKGHFVGSAPAGAAYLDPAVEGVRPTGHTWTTYRADSYYKRKNAQDDAEAAKTGEYPIVNSIPAADQSDTGTSDSSVVDILAALRGLDSAPDERVVHKQPAEESATAADQIAGAEQSGVPAETEEFRISDLVHTAAEPTDDATSDTERSGASGKPHEPASVAFAEGDVIRALMGGEDPAKMDRALARRAEPAEPQPLAPASEETDGEEVTATINTAELADVKSWYGRLQNDFRDRYAGDLGHPGTVEEINTEINTNLQRVAGALGSDARLANAVVAGIGIGAVRDDEQRTGHMAAGTGLAIARESGLLTEGEMQQLTEVAGVIAQAKSRMNPGNKTTSLKTMAEKLDEVLGQLPADEHQTLRTVLVACGAGFSLEDNYGMVGLNYRAQLEQALADSIA